MAKPFRILTVAPIFFAISEVADLLDKLELLSGPIALFHTLLGALFIAFLFYSFRQFRETWDTSRVPVEQVRKSG